MKSNLHFRRIFLHSAWLAVPLSLAAVTLVTSASAQIDDDDDDDDIIIDDEGDDDEGDDDVDDTEGTEDPGAGSESDVTDDDGGGDQEQSSSDEEVQVEEPARDVADDSATESEQPSTPDPEIAEEDTLAEEDVVIEAPAVAPSDARLDEHLVAEAAQAALRDAPSREVSLAPITFSTSTFSRFEWRQGYDDLGVSRGRFMEGDQVVFRARLGMQTHPLSIGDGSDVLIQFTPQASGSWGQNGTVGEANLGLYEGYVKFRSNRLDVQVGRLMMNYGDAVVIGNLDWHQTGRAFDGLRGHYKMNRGYLDLFVTQVASGGFDSGPKLFSGDDLFWGAYLGVGNYIADNLDLDAYFLGLSNFAQQNRVDPASGATYDMDSAHLFTTGLRTKQKLGFFDYRLEGTLQFGHSVATPPAGYGGGQVKNRQVFAYQVDAEFGASLSPSTRVALGGVLASGDDPSTSKNEGYNELYPTGHKFLGLMDIIGARTNIASANLKVNQGFSNTLRAELDAHVFARLQDGGLGSVAGAGFAGTEFDFQLLQALGRFAQVRGLYGLFIPASGQYASDNLAHYVEIEAGLRF